MRLRILSGLWLSLALGLCQADEIELNPGHPERYVVAPGDTLWDIAGKFLAKPWQWPEIWQENRQIADPHWIYPGDELVLSMAGGRPRLQFGRRARGEDYAAPGPRPDEARLSPVVRVSPVRRAVPSIPINIIQPFLTEPRAVDADTLEQAPYVVSMVDDHVVGGAGDRIYVREMTDPRSLGQGYMLFRQGKPYTDAESGEVLGYEAMYVANAEVQALGDPATLKITKSERNVSLGDRVQPIEVDKVQMRFEPRPPARPVTGHIIAVIDGVSEIGQWSVVVLDRGAADGLEVGNVLEVRQGGRVERDIISSLANEEIVLPPEKEGVVMVFRPYARVSFALVMNATRAIHLYDAVANP